MTIKRIDHIAVVVESLTNALRFFEETLGLEMVGTAEEPDQQVTVAFMPVGGSDVELVEPDESDSGVAQYLDKRGEGVHHICFEVSDIDAVVARLKEAGTQLINAEPVTNSRGWRLAFVHPKAAHGVLIELCEKAEEQ